MAKRTAGDGPILGRAAAVDGIGPEAPDAAASRLAAIVHSSDDAIVSKDLNGTIVTWNPAAERMFGYAAAEAIGQSILLIIPEGLRAEEEKVLSEIRSGREVAHFETVRRRKDGELIPISLSVSPVRDKTGTVVGASKIARDISERRQAEAALARVDAARAELERRLMALVAASASMFVSPSVGDALPAILKVAGDLVPSDARAIWRRDAARGVWRIEGFEHLSESFTSEAVLVAGTAGELAEPLAIPDVQSSPIVAERRSAFEAEGIRSALAVPLALPDGPGILAFYYRSRHDFDRVEIQTVVAVANMASAAIGAARFNDVERRSRLDADFLARAGTLLASSLEYELTLKRVADLAVPFFADWCGVDLVDDHGVPRRLALSHADPEKIDVAKRFTEQYPEDPHSPYSVAHVVHTGRSAMIEDLTDEQIAQGARDEAHRQAILDLDVRSFMIVPLTAHGHTFGAITFVAGDARRRYGAPDLQLAEQLAYRAAIAVDNARAYDEVRRANRLKDDFIATLSHELRTPLNALVGYARMLRQGLISPRDQRQAFEVLDRNATALTNIVNDIFDISRVSSGKLRLKVRNVDLSELVRQCTASIEDVARAKLVRIDIVVPSVPVYADVDPDRMQQVIWNLLSNGVKFTPSGGRIEIRVRMSPASNQVEVAIRDTGIGIPTEFLPHVFDPFRQADSRLTREYGGLGLGLAIVRHLVELHHGTVEATSQGTGQGATFTVRLPVSQGAVTKAPGDSRDASIDPGPARTTRLAGKRVLVVDDDPDALTMIRQVLESAGADVISANSPRQALTLAGGGADVLLSDIGMPGLDGFELLARVRAMPGNGQLPAAALTAFSRPEDRDRAIAAGFQTYLSKPIDPDDLLVAIEALVSANGRS